MSDQLCERCDAENATRCCDAHAKMLCHWCYRYTHFVQVCGCDECEDERRTADEVNRDQWEDDPRTSVEDAAAAWAADPLLFVSDPGAPYQQTGDSDE